MLAAIKAVRGRKPKGLVLAVSVAPLDTVKKLCSEVDAIVCLDTPEELTIGYFYRDVRQVDDEEVVGILKRLPAKRVLHASNSST